MNYSEHFNTKETVQTQPIPGKAQVENNAGGFVFSVEAWDRLTRFLLLGTEGGTYYAKESKLTIENAQTVLELIKNDGKRVVSTIVEISKAGRAPKNDPAIFALALCTAMGDADTKAAAYSAITAVCRTGTHLFTFCEQVQALRGWSRGLRTGVGKFYTKKNIDNVALQLVKYRRRNGWTHRDVLRLSHPKTTSAELNSLLSFAVGKEGCDHPLIKAFNTAQTLKNDKAGVKTAITLIKEYRLPWEALPTELLGSKEIWTALLDDMPMTAMVRNLGKMTSIGVLESNLSNNTKKVVTNLMNKEFVKASKLHPLNVLLALKTYQSGGGYLGKLTWTPVSSIVDALEHAYYAAFDNVEATNKKYYLGVDVSGSMSSPINGKNISCAEAASALAMTIVRTEPFCEVRGFTSSGSGLYGRGGATELTDLGVRKGDGLTSVLQKVQKSNFGSTDCALPILDAIQRNLEVDTFIILTDNQTYAGNIHPTQALAAYRKKTGINAKLIVIAMTSSGFTIADPNDAGMLDIVGFDTAMPQLIAEFSK